MNDVLLSINPPMTWRFTTMLRMRHPVNVARAPKLLHLPHRLLTGDDEVDVDTKDASEEVLKHIPEVPSTLA